MAIALAACSAREDVPQTNDAAMSVSDDLLERYDFSLAETPNERTALAYLYMAWNDNRLADARARYWVPGSFPAGGGSGPPVSPRYTIHNVIEEGDNVVVLAFVEGVGIGDEITTIFGQPGGIKIGDAVVEIFRFDEGGLISEKWDIIEPLSEQGYDFRSEGAAQ